MRKKSGLLFLFTVLLCSAMIAKAQNWEIGLGAGAAGYMGDLNKNNPLKFSGPAVGGFVKLNLDPYWSLGMNYNYGRIEGDNGNLKFYAPLHEVSALVDFNFFDFFAGGGRRRFSPFIYAGLGGLVFNAKRNVGNEVKYLRLYRTENQSLPYKNYAFSIPYGAGMKFKMSTNFTIFGQLGYRTAYTDYLDDVKGTYRRITDGNPERIFLSNPSGNPENIGMQRGDSRKRDTYMLTQIGVSYTFLCRHCDIF
jgi:opacity protein-like surface antigen